MWHNTHSASAVLTQAGAPPQTILSIEAVSKNYGNIQALKSTSLEVRSGEVVALLGPNGAGKSTLVNLILGLLKPTSGSVRVFGGDPTIASHRIRTGCMLQSAALAYNLSVRELIELFSSYYPDPLPLQQVLEMAGLTDISTRLYGKLSGGQKRKVCFGIAICGNPELIVMDEPTTAMDVETRRDFWKQVKGFIQSGKTVLLTTHHLEEADALADRIVMIDQGQIIKQATPHALKADLSIQHVSFKSSLPASAFSQIAGVRTVQQDGDRIKLVVNADEVIAPRLYEIDPNLKEFAVRPADLEDVFFALTQKGGAA